MKKNIFSQLLAGLVFWIGLCLLGLLSVPIGILLGLASLIKKGMDTVCKGQSPGRFMSK